MSILAQQTAGALRGVVTDPSGGGVPNAKIDLRNNATCKVFWSCGSSFERFAGQF